MAYDAYIITEEGRRYTDEGLEQVYELLVDEFNIKDTDIVFHQGTEINKPEILIQRLTDNANAALIISLQGGVCVLADEEENINVTIPLLKNHPDQTCWLTIKNAIEKS